MSIIFFVIFMIATVYFVAKDPYWGLISYVASLFLGFQYYIPELKDLPIHIIIFSLTAVSAFANGNFRKIKIDRKLVLTFVFVVIIIMIPLVLKGYYSEKYRELFGRGFFTFFIILLVTNKKKTMLFTQTFYIMVVFITLMLIHCHYVGSNYYFRWRHEQPVAQGFLAHPNSIVFYLLIGMVMAFNLVTYTKKNYLKCLYAFSALLIVYGIMICASRSGIFGFFVASGLIVFFAKGKEKIILIIFICLIAAIVATKAGGKFWQRYEMLTGVDETGQMEDSAQGRLNYWANGWEIFREHPIVGVGAYNIGKYNTKIDYDGSIQGVSLHESFIEVFAENGIVGGTLWVLLIIMTIKDLLRYRKITSKDKDSRELIVSCKLYLCCIGTYFVAMLLGSVQYSGFLFLLFGISSSLKNQINNRLYFSDNKGLKMDRNN